jgi:Ca2+-binding RTX toxin-like protein
VEKTPTGRGEEVASHDAINGGPGDDTMFGGQGNDTLTGGPGADGFHGGQGTDTAADFNAGEGDTMTGIP